MTTKRPQQQAQKPSQPTRREDRLKAALKANLKRRKDQARSRKDAAEEEQEN